MPPAAEAAPACEALQIRTSGATSVLHRVRLPGFTDVRVGELPYRINALGYSRSPGWAYGIAEGFADGGHVVALRPSDPPLDLGPVVAGRGDTPWNPIGHPEAGAIRGDRWYVLDEDYLYTVDVDPDSPTFRHVLSSRALERRHGPFSVDDVDFGPDGLLRGVAQTYTGIPAVVRLDQSTGVVEPVRWLPELPPDSYGSAVIGQDDALYVTGNRSGGVYRIGEGETVKLAELPGMSSSDAAGCLRRPPPPPPPPPPPSPPPPTPAPPTSSEAPQLPSPPPVASSSPEPAEPRPTPTPSAAPPPPEDRPEDPPSETPESATPTPSEETDSEESGHTTQEKRRWALAGLVLLIGGSAAVRRLGRG
ncbi:hypothetical protein QFW96_26905 [Saccharopolyspora sp. TS4A08]|uniref:DUF6923 domain-containing protein n=1 Tax=Saccharopolyspora ipomoeae TaxID=3042027 RepID=A0ABT6PW98_9PSEU|nr:hypothetical protein [Saccharopolyspora sp. TS4A08]MDI2032277.1 hypothetical protein [Saccharopolyspora sp. TS4A08]